MWHRLTQPGQRHVLRVACVAGLLVLGFALQARFFAAYPQPFIFGDPRGYYETGQAFLAAVRRLAAGDSLAAVFESVRGLFFLLGVGTLFATLEALRPGDLAFFRLVLAAFNTLAMLGVFLLGRRLSRSDRGGFVALALAIVFPAFSVQTGRLYPDPVTSCFFVWAAWLYLAGVETGRRRFLLGAGLALTAALIVRSQLALYLLLVLPLAFAASAAWWWRAAGGRRRAALLALGLLPLLLLWAGVDRAVGQRDDVIRFGNLTFRPPYPYGFWQFLECDGWSAAYQFKSEPFYQAMSAENRAHPGLLSSRRRQLAFTARYVADRPLESAGVVLNNVYRLLDRPANDYKWDYPIPYSAQVVVQRAVVVAALCGLAVFASEGLATLGVFFLPLALMALHGVMFVWPRYNVPIMPILIAAAGAAVARVALRRETWRSRPGRPALLVTALAAAGLGLGAAFFDLAPQPARALRLVGLLAALGLAFLLARRAATGRHAGAWCAGVWAALAVVVTVHAARDRQWHELSLALDRRTAAVEQEILLTPEALTALRAAGQAFVVLDLTIPRGTAEGLALEVGGRRFEGAQLIPSMPRAPESTWTGGRNWRGYPQWWALPLDPALLPQDAAEPLRVRLLAQPRAGARLGADRFGEQQQVYEGPSFGERPNLVALKLEYDGDSRLPVRYALGSRATRTTLVDERGRRRPLAGVARVRLIALERALGSTRWRSAPAAGPRSALGFFAYAGVRGSAELTVDGRQVLSFPLDRPEDYEIEAPPARLCHRALGERGDKPYGAYVLELPAAGRALDLQVAFRTGMDDRRMFFVVDRRRAFGEIEPFFERCGVAAGVARVAGVSEVLEASGNSYPGDTGYWTVAAAY